MATDHTAQRALIARLRAVLPRDDPSVPVDLVETHISWVLLTGATAYKIKKAVDLGFVDFTTLERRLFFCDEELRLNRRLAPAIYLDVVAIAGTLEHPVPGGNGPPLEYAVKMREFPQAALASHVLARGELAPAHIDALAADVAAFHDRIAVARANSAFGMPGDIRQIALQNFDAPRASAEDAAERADLDALYEWTQREHAARVRLFVQRRAQGFVRECHGDLHLGNMVLLDGRLVVFDCIEFSERLRWIDVMSEVAFVVMDLQDRGAPTLAHRFLNDYLEITGDYAGLPVLRFYLVYRAMVRGMVTRLRVNQMEAGEAKRELLAEYRAYLGLARHFARPPRPAIVVAHGLSGCGKTTLTLEFLALTGAVRIRTDVERKRLYGLRADERTDSAIASGLYAADATRATYHRVLADARCVVAAGDIAVIDATFLHRWQRDMFRQFAADLGIPFVIVAFAASEPTLRRRLAQRSREGGDASDADIAVLEHQLRTQEPLGPDEHTFVVEFDTEAPKPDAWHPVLARIGLA